MNSIVLRIQSAYDNMNENEQKIADFIISSSNNILSVPIAQLASQLNVSQPAIVRFCKKLGLDGYKDFKRELASGLIRNTPDKEESYSDIKVGDSPFEIIEKIAGNHIKTIEDTVRILDAEEFSKALDALSKARRIDFYGAGASGLVAMDAQHKFMRIGKNCCCYMDAHIQSVSVATLAPDDVAVFISYSGMTKDIIDLVHSAKENGAKTIAITKFGGNRLSKAVDICLTICSREITVRSSATSSRISQLLVIDMLFTGVAGQNYQESHEMLLKSQSNTAKKRY